MNRVERTAYQLVARLSVQELHLLAMALGLPVVEEVDDIRHWLYQELQRRMTPEHTVLLAALWGGSA